MLEGLIYFFSQLSGMAVLNNLSISGHSWVSDAITFKRRQLLVFVLMRLHRVVPQGAFLRGLEPFDVDLYAMLHYSLGCNVLPVGVVDFQQMLENFHRRVRGEIAVAAH